MDQKNVSQSSSILKSAGFMGIATFLSRIAGLVREQVFAVFFGAGDMTDAFNIAFRIPNLMRDLFAEGALSSAFIPTFTRTRVEQGDRAAWRVAGLVFRVLFVVVTIISFLGILFAPELVRLFASSYQNVPGKFELTVLMTRVLFFFFPLVALAAAFMGVLNACGRFFLPAFASALFNITSIVVGLFCAWLMPRYGIEPIVGMAIGVVFGGAVQAFCQLPQLYKAGYRFTEKTNEDLVWYKNPALKQMMVLMLPSTIGLAAVQINVLINSVLATSQGTGAVSWLNYAFRLMQFPIGVFGVSIAAATLPMISKLHVQNDFEGIQKTLTQSLKQVFAINLPAAAGLAFLGGPILALIFEYGQFGADDTRATAQALAAYSVGLTAYSVVKILVPACYAFGRTRVAVVSSVASIVFTLVFGAALVRVFGFWGLALSTSISALFNAVYLIWVLRSHLQISQLVRAFAIHLFLALVMGFIVWQGHLLWNHAMGEPLSLFFRLFKVGVLVSLGAGVVIGLGTFFKVPETLQIVHLFSKKLKNKLSPR